MNAALQLAMETSLRAAALAACVAAILAAARVRSGAVRHAAWAAVLAAMLLMPLLPRLTPNLGVPVPMPVAAEPAPPMPDLPQTPPMPSVLAPAQSQPAPAAPDVPAPSPRPPVWPIALVTVYAAGLLLLLLRMATGWHAARRILRSAEPALRAATVRERLPLVYQSPLVASPLTIGILSPRIVLPRAWSTWPDAKLRAVLAHEAAHVRRRDTVVSFAAHLNRCLFWFHPLAWWLERQLAITAEHACDEAAVRATGQGPEYAQVLVDFAETALRSGGRLSLQGAGIDNAGPLEGRISRILRGDLARTVSRPRKAAVAIACATAIFLAAACQPSREALVAKAEARAQQDKERSVRATAYMRSMRDLYSAASAMTAEQAAALETALTKDPDDLQSHKKLLAYYSSLRGRATAKPDLQSIFAAIRRHALWMVEHHPEESSASNASAFTFAPGADYERAKSLWLAQADRDGRPAAVYVNAAAFFRYDLPLFEKMLLRAQAADPKGDSLQGMYMDSWSSRMGSFYGTAFAMYGLAPGSQISDWIQSHVSEEAQTAYLSDVTRKLQQSTDTTLLLSAANVLVAMHRPNEPSRHPGIDAFAAGKAALERAMQLDPKSGWARQILNEVRDKELTATLPKAVLEGPLESRHQAIEALPEGDRFRELSFLAISAGPDAFGPDHLTSTAWQQAARYAREALELAPKVRNHPDYGTAFFRSNMILGMAALSAGDAKTADAYLLKAADAPATDELRYPMSGERPWPMNWQFPNALTAALLKAGERNAVADFLDRYAKLCVTRHESALEDAALIRSGKTPPWAGL